MRVFALVLLMLLMPLRAWAGDAMALSVLPTQSHLPAQTTDAQPADAQPADAHPAGHGAMTGAADHPDHADHAGHAPIADAAADDHCPSHNACDVCNGPVLSLTAWQDDAAPAPHHVQAAPDVRFASLVPPRRHKPPIA